MAEYPQTQKTDPDTIRALAIVLKVSLTQPQLQVNETKRIMLFKEDAADIERSDLVAYYDRKISSLSADYLLNTEELEDQLEEAKETHGEEIVALMREVKGLSVQNGKLKETIAILRQERKSSINEIENLKSPIAHCVRIDKL